MKRKHKCWQVSLVVRLVHYLSHTLAYPLELLRLEWLILLPLLIESREDYMLIQLFHPMVIDSLWLIEIISSLPTYYMCTLQLPKTFIDNIDREKRHCLWRGSDVNSNKKIFVCMG